MFYFFCYVNMDLASVSLDDLLNRFVTTQETFFTTSKTKRKNFVP